MLPPAHGLFSTSTVRLRSFDICCAMLRATVSVVPPGGAPTTSLMASFWAHAAPGGSAMDPITAHAAAIRCSPTIGISPGMLCCIDDNTTIPVKPGRHQAPCRYGRGGRAAMRGLCGRTDVAGKDLLAGVARAVGFEPGQAKQHQHTGEQPGARQAPSGQMAELRYRPHGGGQACQRRQPKTAPEDGPAAIAARHGLVHCIRGDTGLATARPFELYIHHCHKPLLAYIRIRQAALHGPAPPVHPDCAARYAQTSAVVSELLSGVWIL